MVYFLSEEPETDTKGGSALSVYLRQIGGRRLLTRDEERDLARNARHGDREAAARLVQSNLRFVVKVAKKYQFQGLPLEDLICEGNIGLMQAVPRFDERKGFKFISYAVWWIRQAIVQALIGRGRLVRTPANRISRFQKIKRATRTMEQLLGRPPTLDEIAEETGIVAETVLDLSSLASGSVSLDVPVGSGGEGDDLSLGDYIAVDSSEAVDDQVTATMLKSDLSEAMSRLTSREAWVLEEYFGLSGGEPRTLYDIGCEVGLTKERIRQIKEQALGKLREPEVAGQLAEYLYEQP